MGIFQKINNLFAKKQKIEKEIAILQKSCNHRKKSVKLVRVPKFSEVPYPVIMEPSLVIEYYSR